MRLTKASPAKSTPNACHRLAALSVALREESTVAAQVDGIVSHPRPVFGTHRRNTDFALHRRAQYPRAAEWS